MPTAQLRLVTPTQRRPVREPVGAERVISVTVVADDRVLLTVGEAAHRLGIGRSFMYELIAAGQIETIHIGRLCKISVDAIAAFVERQTRVHGVGSRECDPVRDTPSSSSGPPWPTAPRSLR